MEDIKRLMELAGMTPSADLLSKYEFTPEIEIVEETLENDQLGVPTPTAQEVADKHGVSIDDINEQLKMGIEIELEHVDDIDLAEEIALDHLSEMPDYYTRLKNMELEAGVEEDYQYSEGHHYTDQEVKEALYQTITHMMPGEFHTMFEGVLTGLDEVGNTDENMANFARQIVEMVKFRLEK